MHPNSADPVRVLIVGNPNAGKSALFNRLTGGHARVGNWHGVTVGVSERVARLGGERYRVCDLPGIYAAESMTLEERVACNYLEAHEGILLLVAECARLDRALALFSVLAVGRRCVLVLTKRRMFERRGGCVQRAALERALGIPVLFAEGGGLRGRVAQALRSARICRDFTAPGGAYRPAERGLSRIERLWLAPWFALPAFLCLLVLCFYLTFGAGMPGCLARDAIGSLFTHTLAERAHAIGSPLLRSLVAEGLLGGLGSVLGFLPQICMLFLFLILLEESGLISRLAWMTDATLSRVGLNGRAVFSLLMGFGCTAAAILTTRGMEDRVMQKRVILCLPYIACSAKLPVLLTLSASFFRAPFVPVLALYALGVGMAMAMALLLRREKPAPFLLELAPLALPSLQMVVKSLLFQIRQFIIKMATVILAFLLFSWLLSSFNVHGQLCEPENSLLAQLCRVLRVLFAPMGMNDWRIAYAALSGLIAKENVAGALAMLCGGFGYSLASGAAFAVFLLTASPCVSAIAASAREVGALRALLYAVGQTVSALLLGYITYFMLTGGAPVLLAVLAPAAALFIFFHGKALFRRKNDHIKTIHR